MLQSWLCPTCGCNEAFDVCLVFSIKHCCDSPTVLWCSLLETSEDKFEKLKKLQPKQEQIYFLVSCEATSDVTHLWFVIRIAFLSSKGNILGTHHIAVIIIYKIVAIFQIHRKCNLQYVCYYFEHIVTKACRDMNKILKLVFDIYKKNIL